MYFRKLADICSLNKVPETPVYTITWGTNHMETTNHLQKHGELHMGPCSAIAGSATAGFQYKRPYQASWTPMAPSTTTYLRFNTNSKGSQIILFSLTS